MRQLTPREIVSELNHHIIGQADAKRAVAIAVRNRWRRQQLPEGIREEITPKNILMIGPTGVGKTEIARRLAKLTGAPFVKVEATKYTEVGYYGRDVESMIRELVENAIGLVRATEREKVLDEATRRVEERILDILVPLSNDNEKNPLRTQRKGRANRPHKIHLSTVSGSMPKEMFASLAKLLQQAAQEAEKNGDTSARAVDFSDMANGTITIQPDQMPEQLRTLVDTFGVNTAQPEGGAKEEPCENSGENPAEKADETEAEENAARLAAELRESMRRRLRAGELDNETIEIPVKKKAASPFMMMNLGNDSMDSEISSMFDRLMPQKTVVREMPVKDAWKILLDEQCAALINEDKVNVAAIELAESTGIIFLDEIDKIVASEQSHGADVSRQGVQRDLLPIVEGTTIQTRYGYVKTDHILFIAAGAFHRNKPSDLMPELQGRFPIRVELKDLTQEDFKLILREPKNSLLLQYEELLKTEGVDVVFEEDAIDALASYAWKVNQTSMNIGARRLYTILERLLEELSFEASEIGRGQVKINAAYVNQRLEDVSNDEDLSRFIL
ncbi:MAG: ATP-dependent protease ATPase subunit HslU [Planctomycetia bacterium]|nr:ATP-dependent protease ATPase subunit HslU [Planctomycetia bacterium]